MSKSSGISHHDLREQGVPRVWWPRLDQGDVGGGRFGVRALRATGRVQGLSYTHDLVAAEDWRGARLGELASRQLAHFVEPMPPRVYLTGPNLMMSTAAAQHVGLALHELAANAIQYGALSIPQGSVSLRWVNDARMTLCPWIRLTWSESCGPRVIVPEHRNFGSLILERLVPEALGGGK